MTSARFTDTLSAEDVIPNRFLIEVADESIDDVAWTEWLYQDLIFVKNSIRFMCVLAAKAPEDIMLFLVDSAEYIKKELDLFKDTEHKKISIVCRAYCDFMLARAYNSSFLEAFTVFYCEERLYYEAWSWVRKNTGKNRYQKYIDHWGSDEFYAYVKAIDALLNREAENSEQDKGAREAFLETAEFERSFWQIAYDKKI